MKNTGKYIIIIFSILLFFSKSIAQISRGGLPPSFKDKSISKDFKTVMIPGLDLSTITGKDFNETNNGTLYKIARTIAVDLNPKNSGTWSYLPGGGKIWRLKIISKNALALGVYYNNFNLPNGGQLFLYNKNKQQLIGAFTHLNNNESGLFANEFIQGDEVNLEYYQPKSVNDEPVINISEIAYAYRSIDFLFDKSIKGFGSSDPCEVNANCQEGNDWQLQKGGVVRISIKEGAFIGWCSGSLVNNVRQDKTPYMLTADHCGGNATAADLNQWIFYFNYEGIGCANPPSQPVPFKTITGCALKAHGGDGGNTGSDFYLVLLNNNVPVSYSTFFNGWDRTNVPSSGGVCIHHPSGDIKKISTYSTYLVTDTWAYVPNTHWRVKWTTTTNGHGVTEGGSSGSPIFSSDGKIIGTLTGGSSACVSGGAGPYTGPNEPDFYGKFSYSWDKNGNNASQRLKNWLDPDNTGTTILNGLFFGVKENEILESLVVYPNPTSKDLYIDFGDNNVNEINITIFNILGKLVYSHEDIVENKLHINMSDLTSGIYFLNIQTDKGFTTRKVFVIR